MAYEYEDEIKEELEFIRFEFIGNQNEMLRELQEVYFKAEILNRIIGIVKNGRSLGSDTDSEIILRAIEHELKYTEDK
ncbi:MULTISPECIES: hypothetical protein [Staphylococcus]|uniref:hypothetical protein n=1 Tax=Staphylococcus TaxID=1279 RepID=UPI00092B72DC|nr:hypothetical protein [Staphylococcus ureilyticus]OJT35336.1 hypothetical protein BSF33_04590 [Staphylococcus ureilyticus]